MKKQNWLTKILENICCYLLIGIMGLFIPLEQPAIALTSRSQPFIAQSPPQWGYQGKTKPENWGKISSDYQTCQNGLQQSPIDIDQPLAPKFRNPQLDYQSIPLKLANTGSTIQIKANSDNKLIIDNEIFELVQLHFHNPSEHQLKGQAFPMEAHLVHKNQEGKLLVVGIFIKSGQENIALQPIWDQIPAATNKETNIAQVSLNLQDLIPENKHNYQYIGSLTTPPCTEGVQWVLLAEPIELSQQQIKQFHKIFPVNARPIQPLKQQLLLP